MGRRATGRFDELLELVSGHSRPAVAFSGGVDSSLVALAACRAHGDAALAVTVSTELTAPGEVERAADIASLIGIRHESIELSVLTKKGMPDNPPDRCYHCKKAVFAAIGRTARKLGCKVVMDGTNAEDSLAYRPGLKALAEMGVVSPLALLGFGKEEIRRTARAMDLPNWDVPARPCLATRFPYGDRLTPEGIERAAMAEAFLESLGFAVFRVRDHGGIARLELGPAEMKKAAVPGTAKKIVAKLLSLGYNYVTLDLEGFRSGSMDRAMGR